MLNRIFQLTNNAALTLDPAAFKVTNTFPYSAITSLSVDEKTKDQIKVEFNKTKFVYQTAHRAHLLCQLFECVSKSVPNKYKIAGPYRAQRVRKNGSRVDCRISVAPYGIIEADSAGRLLQEYFWVNMPSIGTDERNQGFFFEYSGRMKLFVIDGELNQVIVASKAQLKQLGLDGNPFLSGQDMEKIMTFRHTVYSSIQSAVSTFDVNKITRRSLRPMPRQMHISEQYIVEKDASGFQFVSYQKVSDVYALVRSWTNPREFSLEFNDNSSRTYTCGARDTLLAMLLDVCHASGNARVIVTGEVSDGLRLMPRFSEEAYTAKLSDTFFGSSSIEAWYLARLAKVCKAPSLDGDAIEKACKELNANVPCPGIAPNSDPSFVKSALVGVLRQLNHMVSTVYRSDRADCSRPICTMLQTLFRIIPSTSGFKYFVEVKEVDTRQLLLMLLKYDHDFVNYWTLEVLMVLCRCPTTPRNAQQEFVNKHTLLTDKMLVCLIDLMSLRLEQNDVETDATEEKKEDGEGGDAEEGMEDGVVGAGEQGAEDDVPKSPSAAATSGFAAGDLSASASSVPASERASMSGNIHSGGANSAAGAARRRAAEASAPAAGGGGGGTPMKKPAEVAINPSGLAHIPVIKGGGEATKAARELAAAAAAAEASGTGTANDFINFMPNSLVVNNAAALLESIISSKKDTSSPELVNGILDLLNDRCEVLISMLKSTSFLIMENAAILMSSLIRNRPAVGPLLKELALSDCLVLKHFYNAVFSPSSTQRFLSRFLVATWVSGEPKKSAGKALLMRMIPSGLTEYLKHAAITEEMRKNLDLMEEEFYSTFGGAGVKREGRQVENSKNVSTDMCNRIRQRITASLRDQLVDKPAGATTVSAAVPVVKPTGAGGSGGAGGGGGESSNAAAIAAAAAAAGNKTVLGASSSGSSSGSTGKPSRPAPENYRIMFHVMTNDHRLPDLIWNEQTRLELRNTLETELREFEREQRLLGTKKIAWNYQQFSVMYESLREEMQVGPIYIRYFLDAGDSFLRLLDNPPPVVLFEKLFRRILVNIERKPSSSILCCKCLCRLYEVCNDLIGSFDDMLIIVRMLEQAANMELQHCLLDMMAALSLEEYNLQQLLDKSFVDTVIKYARLCHVNPDQIGNLLARATTDTLMLTDASAADKKAAEAMAAREQANAADIEEHLRMAGEESSLTASNEESKLRKRSMWVPDDIACPKVWFAAPRTELPPPKRSQRGPYRVSELLSEFDRGVIDSTWVVAPMTTEEGEEGRFDSLVDTGRWKELPEVFQLRLQMLFPGKAVYSPAEVATKALLMLQRLATLHRSNNSKGVPFYPMPQSKRIMSEPQHLQTFAQMILSNDNLVVSIAAGLLRSLVEFSSQANSKLYLTGVFFFACRHTGNNFLAIAELFKATHLAQGFHDAAASVARDLPVNERSILGVIIPKAMVSILHNYGAERFASVFTGHFDTPEVIWSAELRMHCVEMINQHLGDFPARLRQAIELEYEYCPIPKVHYPRLDKELYVHEYYLRNLCDEQQFADWPIAEPLVLLRECIERWRQEMAKGLTDNSASASKQLLGLPEKYDNAELRKAYKNLARKYHPDRNPNGREMFEKIQVAYELLASIELEQTETDMGNVILLMKTQNILYRRFPGDICDQKYPAYKLLIDCLRIPVADAGSPLVVVQGQDAELLLAATMLMYYTTHVSPLNAKEFVKIGAVPHLIRVIGYGVTIMNHADTAVAELSAKLLLYGFKCLTAVANIEAGRDAIFELCPKFADDTYSMLSLATAAPLVVENCLEVISRCCSHKELQLALIHAGVVWRIIPLLLAYDGTVEDDFTDEAQRMVHNQISCNMHAMLSAKALGRLSGVMFDELASEKRESMKECMEVLLTQPLAKLLRNRRPWDLLQALNENTEKVTKIWNVGMRKELLDFVSKVDKNRPAGSNENDLQLAQGFLFSALKDELCIGGVYVRIFNKTAEAADIDDPSKFARELIMAIDKQLTRVGSGSGAAAALQGVARVHLDSSVEALRALTEKQSYIAYDLAKFDLGITTVFALLEQPIDSHAFNSLTQLLGSLFTAQEFVAAVAQHQPPILWRLLRSLCSLGTSNRECVKHIWSATENLAANPEGLAALINAGAIIRILGVLMGVKGYTACFESRLAAISLMAKFLWNPVKGADASAMLRRFIPEPVVQLLRSKAGNASLQVLDSVAENPELIWTAEMQGELREELARMLTKQNDSTGGADGEMSSFQVVPTITPDYFVRYRQLMAEIYVGGVYIRLFLKQPTFRLTNPVLFCEKVVEFWESSFHIQVPEKGGSSGGADSASDSRAVVLGNEDFLGILTSCLICAVKNEPSLVDHLLSWGFVHTLVDLLKRAVSTGKRGGPMVSVVRIMHQLISSNQADVVDNLASAKTDIVEQLYLCLDDQGANFSVDDSYVCVLPPDSALVVELLKKVFQAYYSRFLPQFVQMAMKCGLPNFLLDHVLGAPQEALVKVNSPSALKIHTVDLLKAIVAAANEETAHILQAVLNSHHAWSEFKDQSHDLFITVSIYLHSYYKY